jgi:hypothetical protein
MLTVNALSTLPTTLGLPVPWPMPWPPAESVWKYTFFVKWPIFLMLDDGEKN